VSSEKEFKWYDFLNLAEVFLDIKVDNIEEAKARTIVSRAYYACYHKALKYLKDKYNFEFEDRGDMHKQVLEAIRCYAPDIADEFGKLHDDRIKADYFSEERISIDKAKLLVEESKEVYRTIREKYK